MSDGVVFVCFLKSKHSIQVKSELRRRSQAKMLTNSRFLLEARDADPEPDKRVCYMSVTTCVLRIVFDR